MPNGPPAQPVVTKPATGTPLQGFPCVIQWGIRFRVPLFQQLSGQRRIITSFIIIITFYFMILPSPQGHAAEKSMPAGSVGDMANGPLLFSISLRLWRGTRGYHIQYLMRTFV